MSVQRKLTLYHFQLKKGTHTLVHDASVLQACNVHSTRRRTPYPQCSDAPIKDVEVASQGRAETVSEDQNERSQEAGRVRHKTLKTRGDTERKEWRTCRGLVYDPCKR